MEKLEENKMTEGLSVADAMSLGNNNGFGDQIWPLIYLSAFNGGNGGMFGGGRNDAAAGVTVAGIEGLQNQINGLLNTINANTSVLQHDAVKQQLCNMGTLIQSGNADITAGIAECCCKTQAAICDLGYKILDGNKDILAAICTQTQNLTLQNVNMQQGIAEAVRREGDATRALINENMVNEKDEKIRKCEIELSENRIINALKESGSWTPPGGEMVTICHNGQTLELPAVAAEAHLLNHPGDTVGPCPPEVFSVGAPSVDGAVEETVTESSVAE